jgi:flagellin
MLGTKGTPNTQTDLAYTAVSAAEGSQTVTLSANDASGTAHTLSVNLTLANSTTMAATLGVINNALQASDDSTLKQITAVDNAGATTLNFISNLSNFQVSLGSTLAGATGLGSVAQHGTTISSLQVGAGGTADIGTIAGAQAAVSAITAAVGTLGVAQAAVGTGENQLAFASSLAQSQITNFSSAESQIRDANVAQQAANLSKAQVLQQSSIAAMAQANAEPQALLTLLKQ